jgi:hypothetical protein
METVERNVIAQNKIIHSLLTHVRLRPNYIIYGLN